MVRRTMGRKGWLPELPENEAFVPVLGNKAASSFVVNPDGEIGLRSYDGTADMGKQNPIPSSHTIPGRYPPPGQPAWPPPGAWPYPEPPLNGPKVWTKRYLAARYAHDSGAKRVVEFLPILATRGIATFLAYVEGAIETVTGDTFENATRDPSLSRKQRKMLAGVGAAKKKEFAMARLVEHGALHEVKSDIESGALHWVLNFLMNEWDTSLPEHERLEVTKKTMREWYATFPGREFPGYVVDSDQTDFECFADIDVEQVMTANMADVLAPLDPASREAVLANVVKEFKIEKDAGIAQSNVDVNLLRRELSHQEQEVVRIKAELLHLHLNAEMREIIAPFVLFCRAIRGYDRPEHRGEPGAHLMAMGRIFLGQEDVKLEELSAMLEGIETVTRGQTKWEDIAPNARAGYEYLDSMFQKASGNWLVHFSRAWARDGFPTVELPHKTAAALMFTDGDPAATVDPPWRGFLVKVPDGLVRSPTRNLTLARVLAWYAPEEINMRWWVMLQFRGDGVWKEVTYGLATLDAGRKMLLEATRHHAEAQDLVTDEAGIEELTNATLLACRLVAGCCMMVSAKENVTEKAWVPRPSKTKHRSPGVEPPEGTRWIIGKNVEIDLREQVVQFISGKTRKGGKLTFQHTVRGHRRNQAWGPKHSLRREIWILPYWKGPLAGEALMRGYEIKQPEQETVDVDVTFEDAPADKP